MNEPKLLTAEELAWYHNEQAEFVAHGGYADYGPLLAHIAALQSENDFTREMLVIQIARTSRAENEQDALAAALETAMAALTPSGETKGAYMVEFSFTQDGHRGNLTVPWTTIKEIMEAIRKRAVLNAKDGR